MNWTLGAQQLAPRRCSSVCKRVIKNGATITSTCRSRSSKAMTAGVLAPVQAPEGAPLSDVRCTINQLCDMVQDDYYIWLTGSPDMSHAGTHLLDVLGVLFDALSKLDPRTYAVPLLPWAGWTPDQVANIPSLEVVAMVPNACTDLQQILEQLQQQRQPSLPPLRLACRAAVSSHAASEAPAASASSRPAHADTAAELAAPSQVIAADTSDSPSSIPLSFSRVAVGGTFDRLHCGHELLLAATALVATQHVFIGVTADALLSKKNYRQLIQPYEDRRDTAIQYVKATRPGLAVEAGPLSDPKEPTMAELDPSMEAIVVSHETLPGAIHINEGRKARGFGPLTIVVVPIIGSTLPGDKLSSSTLRAQDASRTHVMACV